MIACTRLVKSGARTSRSFAPSVGTMLSHVIVCRIRGRFRMVDTFTNVPASADRSADILVAVYTLSSTRTVRVSVAPRISAPAGSGMSENRIAMLFG